MKQQAAMNILLFIILSFSASTFADHQAVGWGENCSYTAEAQVSTLSVLQSETSFVTTIEHGKDKVFIDLSATADLDLKLVAGDGTDDEVVLIEYNRGWTHGSTSLATAIPFAYHGMGFLSCVDRCEEDLSLEYHDGTTFLLEGDASYSDEWVYINVTTEVLTLYVRGYAAGTGTVSWLWDCPAECDYCTAVTPSPTVHPIPAPTALPSSFFPSSQPIIVTPSPTSATLFPTTQPTTAQIDDSCINSYGDSSCASYCAAGYCPTYFCETCTYAGYCDRACGICDSNETETTTKQPTKAPTLRPTEHEDTPQPIPAPSPQPTQQPIPTPSPQPTQQPIPAPPSPVQAPTKAPTPTPGPGPNTCFSSDDTLQLESGKKVPFVNLNIGDRILSANRDGVVSYSEVLFLPHGHNLVPTSFLEIITDSSKKIKMTRGHLIQLCTGDLVSAYKLSTDKKSEGIKNDLNCIRSVDGEESVKSIKQVKSNGVYTAVTENEFLVVNDIIASPFASSSGLVHAYFNTTDIEDWCSSNNWLVYEKKNKKSPSHCKGMLTNMFEKFKDEPIGWGADGFGYRGWANPASLHQNKIHNKKIKETKKKPKNDHNKNNKQTKKKQKDDVKLPRDKSPSQEDLLKIYLGAEKDEEVQEALKKMMVFGN